MSYGEGYGTTQKGQSVARLHKLFTKQVMSYGEGYGTTQKGQSVARLHKLFTKQVMSYGEGYGTTQEGQSVAKLQYLHLATLSVKEHVPLVSVINVRKPAIPNTAQKTVLDDTERLET